MQHKLKNYPTYNHSHTSKLQHQELEPKQRDNRDKSPNAWLLKLVNLIKILNKLEKGCKKIDAKSPCLCILFSLDLQVSYHFFFFFEKAQWSILYYSRKWDWTECHSTLQMRFCRVNKFSLSCVEAKSWCVMICTMAVHSINWSLSWMIWPTTKCQLVQISWAPFNTVIGYFQYINSWCHCLGKTWKPLLH